MRNATLLSLFTASMIVFSATPTLTAADWSVAVAGNAFRTGPEPGGKGVRRNGAITVARPDDVFSVYVHLDRPASVELAVEAKTSGKDGTLVCRVGDKAFDSTIQGSDFSTHKIGRVRAEKKGYMRVDLIGSKLDGATVEIRELQVSSDTEGLQLDYVTSNKGNMFYWGRRGPSVHLRYEVPRGQSLRYAYSEITVPNDQDPIGSYYMANGFGEGYFGIQVNSPTERRVLFSVWSPFRTDNPRDIPEDQRIVALAKGPGVHIGEFGNEGSGGQSYLVYPWKSGRTYRFLTKVEPDGNGMTTYTSWFGDKAANEWRLIASFRRPKTDTHLKGFHSFLESFSPTFGYIGRRASYGNVWVGDTNDKWHECIRARFSVDATGGGRQRLDFSGGANGTTFFMRNCGFFSGSAKPGDTFTRQSTKNDQPDIDFDTLPMK